MHRTAKSSLDALNAIGWLSLGFAMLALFIAAAADNDSGPIAALLVDPLLLVGIVFIAAWLLGRAIVGQLAPEVDENKPEG